MLALLTFALLAQADPADLENEFRRLARDYTHPDTPEAERPAIFERILEWGPSAVVRVLEMADTARPDRVGPLRHLAAELKGQLLQRADDEAGRETLGRLQAVTVSVKLTDASPEAFLHQLRLQCTESLIVDPAEQEALSARRLSANITGRSLIETLDRVLGPAGLDFHTRRGVVVVARRDRLWPRAGAAVPLTDEQSRAADAALAALDSESIEERETAERALLALGPGVLPKLSAAAKTARGDLKLRLTGVSRRLLAPEEAGPLHATSAARGQKLGEDDATYLGVLRTKKISYSARDLPLEDVFAMLNSEFEARLDLDPSAAAAVRRKLSFAFTRTGGLDLVESLVLPLGLDVRVEKGRLRIVSR